MPYYAITQLNPWLYSLHDPLEVFCYLAVGKDRALLFDTCHGVGNLPEAIREITDKPVTVVISHGHVDHANGAWQFGEAWLHPADRELYREHTSEEFRRNVVKQLADGQITPPAGFDPESYVKAGIGNLKELKIARVFDLGGLQLEVVSMEGHTAGSVGLLSREQRLLLVSDAASSHEWLFLKESLPISRYLATLERTMALPFDTFFTGHSNTFHTRADLQKFISAARHASIGKAEPYPTFPELKGYIYREDGAEIVFSAEKLR